MTEKTIELPLDVIKASPGFALDIGGSVAKIVYRSKQDFENGQPKDKELAATGKGIVRQKLIPRERVDDFVNFIKENCDLTLAEDGSSVMHTSGVGGNSTKIKLEEELKGKITNLSEMDCFVESTVLLLKTKSAKDIFKPVNEKGLKTAMIKVDTIREIAKAADPSTRFEFLVEDKIDHYDPEIDKQRFPYILVLGGSGFGLLMVNEDGSSRFIEFIPIGGRFFLGGVSFLTGITDFEEISRLILESDGKTVDTFCGELVDSNVQDDIYSALNSDWRIFPFSKGLSPERDQAKKGDLIHSLLESVCENLAMVIVQNALHFNIPRVYFVGNFVNTPKAQEFITREMHSKRFLEETQVNFEFLQDGGILCALGAFFRYHELQTEQQKTE